MTEIIKHPYNVIKPIQRANPSSVQRFQLPATNMDANHRNYHQNTGKNGGRRPVRHAE